jgi:3-hydroxybutyryl-CoA dehydrogenase
VTGQRPQVAVVGAGLMGTAIAWCLAAAGHAVALQDPDAAARDAAPSALASIGALVGEASGAVGRVALHADLSTAVAGASMVIEAAPERLALKRAIFSALAAAAPVDAVLATNTSAIPIGDIADGSPAADRIVGTHFWNPPHLVPLVEVVSGTATAPAVAERAFALLAAAGLEPVRVTADLPGFVGNRLQHALKREAIALVAAGVCSAEDLDTIARSGFGARMAVMGPLEQSDLVGLDLTLAIHEVLIADLDRTPGPHPYLVEKVRRGETGAAAGQGFRSWTPDAADAARARMTKHLVDARRERRAIDGRDDA